MNTKKTLQELEDENAILRSQLHDAREQAKRDTETIARFQQRDGACAQARLDNEIHRLLLIRDSVEKFIYSVSLWSDFRVWDGAESAISDVRRAFFVNI